MAQSIYIRPYIQYQASTAILCRAGKDLGATLTGHHDFQLADDVIHKVHVGHYTFYSVSVVKNDKLLQKAQGVFCREYLGGETATSEDVIQVDLRDSDAAVAGGGPEMSAAAFSKLSSSMLVPVGDEVRGEWESKMGEMRAAAAAPNAGFAAGGEEYADYILVQTMLDEVHPGSHEVVDSLFSDLEDQADGDRRHGLLLVKGTHVTQDHQYINPLGLGPVTYSGSARSRIGKGDPLDKAMTIAELNSIQTRLIAV